MTRWDIAANSWRESGQRVLACAQPSSGEYLTKMQNGDQNSMIFATGAGSCLPDGARWRSGLGQCVPQPQYVALHRPRPTKALESKSRYDVARLQDAQVRHCSYHYAQNAPPIREAVDYGQC